mgnify:CR=1 FL=1
MYNFFCLCVLSVFLSLGFLSLVYSMFIQCLFNVYSIFSYVHGSNSVQTFLCLFIKRRLRRGSRCRGGSFTIAWKRSDNSTRRLWEWQGQLLSVYWHSNSSCSGYSSGYQSSKISRIICFHFFL